MADTFLEHSLSYQDVLLVPRYSELMSRSHAGVTLKFLGKLFRLPVIPANMISVIDEKIAHYLSQNHYFYIYHRFGTNQNGHPDTEQFIKNAQSWKCVSISIGVKEEDFKLLKKVKGNKIDFITIDVAHAHHILVKQAIPRVKEIYPDVPLIVGNVATSEAVKHLVEWGADCIKVGIGQGSICTTRFETGFSVPMFSCVSDCAKEAYWKNNAKGVPTLEHKKLVPLIADGGIQTPGDIAKALAAGATMVMSGHLFAGCCDSPAGRSTNGKKLYFGSTSFEAKGVRKHIEGKAIECDVDTTYEDKLRHLKESLESAVSYAGGTGLSIFKDIDWIVIK